MGNEMPQRHKKCAAEFREGAVRIVEETGEPTAKGARDLGARGTTGCG